MRSVPPSLEAGEPVAVSSALTIADGIAVKRPGGLTLELIKRWVDDIVVVEEDDVAEAMVFLMERAKLVVEGAGAVGVAALMSERVRPRGGGTTVVVLSGGNVDAGLLAEVARRHETQAGRRLVLLARVCPTGRDRWRRYWRWSVNSAQTCSTSSTSARAWTCTCARRRCSSCSRRAAESTPSR